MVTLCWAVKGGSGTTVVTSTLALESTRPALLVDLDGEIDTMLGLPEPDRPGVVDWLLGDGPPTQLDDLLIDIDDTTFLLPCRLGGTDGPTASMPLPLPERWAVLLTWFAEWEAHSGGEVWIDGGTGTPATALASGVEQRWLVSRACYLSLRRAARSPIRPTGVLFVSGHGRQLRPKDVERSVGARSLRRSPRTHALPGPLTQASSRAGLHSSFARVSERSRERPTAQCDGDGNGHRNGNGNHCQHVVDAGPCGRHLSANQQR